MEGSVRSLLDRVIDYAGLFPPAELPLERALHQYLDHRRSSAEWLLARFIAPTTRLDELRQLAQAHALSGGQLPLIALGRGGPDRSTQLAALTADLTAIEQSQLDVGVFELRVPAALLSAERFLDEFAAPLRDASAALPTYFEGMPDGADRIGSVKTAIDAVAAARERTLPTAGFKLRCGGVLATQFPPVELVAATIDRCRRCRVPLKCTAGLHHPIRAFHPVVGTTMHGFINVLVAGVLAHAAQLELELLQQILADQETESFHFEGEGIAWRGVRATSAQVRAARRELIIGFGSCSVDEPVEDLKAIGWL
jgi:hypothetical protein